MLLTSDLCKDKIDKINCRDQKQRERGHIPQNGLTLFNGDVEEHL